MNGVADVSERVNGVALLDFYGPLLTGRRREIMRLYLEEDLSLAEIAEQLGVTRQAVSDALRKGREQLDGYEAALGLVSRYRRMIEQAGAGLEALDSLSESGLKDARLNRARQAFENIIQIER